MDDLKKLKRGLKKVRMLIFAVRAVEQCVRWAAYFAVWFFLYLFLFRMFALKVDWTGVASALGVILACAIAVTLAKIGSIKSSAIYLDKFFGLDERLATALEMSDKKDVGFFDEAMLEDATSIFSTLALGKLRRFNAKREAIMLIVAITLSAVLLLSPSMLNTSENKVDLLKELSQNSALEIKVIAAKLFESAGDKKDVKEIASEAEEVAKRLLKDGEFSDKHDSLKALQKRVDDLIANCKANGLSEKQAKLLKGLSQEVASAGSSLGNAAEKEGIWVPKPQELYKDAVEKFDEIGVSNLARPITKPSGKFESTENFIKLQSTLKTEEQKIIMNGVINAVNKHNWPEKYDEVIKKYYSQ